MKLIATQPTLQHFSHCLLASVVVIVVIVVVVAVVLVGIVKNSAVNYKCQYLFIQQAL